jgi:hypothetical protein
MSFAGVILVLAAVVALANAQYCTWTADSYAVLNSPTTLNTVAAGTTVSATCLPGYTAYSGSSLSLTTSLSVTCSSSYANAIGLGAATQTPSTCSPRNDWCPATVNNNFGNTTTVSAVYGRYNGASVVLLCKPTGLGRNWKGNGTSITVKCNSLADGSGGVWTSDDWCSGALGVSANIALLTLAAVAGLLYKRFF